MDRTEAWWSMFRTRRRHSLENDVMNQTEGLEKAEKPRTRAINRGTMLRLCSAVHCRFFLDHFHNLFLLYSWAEVASSSLPLVLFPFPSKSLRLCRLSCLSLSAPAAFSVPPAPFGCCCLGMQPEGGKVSPQACHIMRLFKGLQMILHIIDYCIMIEE